MDKMTAADSMNDFLGWFDKNIHNHSMVEDHPISQEYIGHCYACWHLAAFHLSGECHQCEEGACMQLQDSLFQPYQDLTRFCSHCIDHFNDWFLYPTGLDNESSLRVIRQFPMRTDEAAVIDLESLSLLINCSLRKRNAGLQFVTIMHSYLHGGFRVNPQSQMDLLDDIVWSISNISDKEILNIPALKSGMIAILLDMDEDVDETLVLEAVRLYLHFAQKASTTTLKDLAYTFTQLPYTSCICEPRCYPNDKCMWSRRCYHEEGCRGTVRYQPYCSEIYLFKYLEISYHWDKAATGFQGMSNLQWCSNAWILALHYGCLETLDYLHKYSFGPGPLPDVVTEEITKLLKCLFLFHIFPEEGLDEDIFTKFHSYLKCMHFFAESIYGYQWLGKSRLVDMLSGMMNYICRTKGCPVDEDCPHAIEYSYATLLQTKSALALFKTERLTDMCWRVMMRNISKIEVILHIGIFLIISNSPPKNDLQ